MVNKTCFLFNAGVLVIGAGRAFFIQEGAEPQVLIHNLHIIMKSKMHLKILNFGNLVPKLERRYFMFIVDL